MAVAVRVLDGAAVTVAGVVGIGASVGVSSTEISTEIGSLVLTNTTPSRQSTTATKAADKITITSRRFTVLPSSLFNS